MKRRQSNDHSSQMKIQPDKPQASSSDCVKRITSIQELELVQKQACPSSMLVEYPSSPSCASTSSSTSASTCSTETAITKSTITSKHHSRSISDTLVGSSIDKGENKDELEMLIMNKTHENIENELAKRAEERQMTSMQEVFNAITMLPTPFIVISFVLMGKWLTEDDILRARDEISHFFDIDENGLGAPPHYPFSINDENCITSSLLPNFHALPPLTTLSTAIGFVMHAPCSIYYHLLCAFKLPPGPKRMDHWSRRLDQAMIHFMSFFICYGSSGSIDYALIALAFALDSMYRLFQSGHRPKRILIRMVGAFMMPIFPMIVNGHFLEVVQLLAIYSLSGWLFSAYPFKGWSHGIFHLVCALSNPIILFTSTKLMASQEAIQTAARCAVLSQAAGFD